MQRLKTAKPRRWTVNRTQGAGTRVLIAGLAVAAVAAGSAAGAVPTLGIPVQARLAPVAGARSAGHFGGLLANMGDQPVRTPALPSNGTTWRLRWKVRLPSLRSPAVVTLRVASHGGTPAVVRTLSARCARSARGIAALTGSQAARVAGGDAVVMVRARSARLRGTVKIQGGSG